MSPLLQLSLLKHTVEPEEDFLNDGDEFDMLEEDDYTDHLNLAATSLDRPTSGGLLGVTHIVMKEDYMEDQF